MNDELKVKTATKIEPDEAKALDPAKMGVGRLDPPVEGEVEGQYRRWETRQCPWCHRIVWCYIDTQVWLWFRCGWCNGAFRA
jgi:hypothetical protein